MKLLQTLTVCSIAAIGSVSEASDVISQGGLPVVDMSVLLEPQTEVYSTHAQSAVESLGKALEEHGFLYLTGHGLSRELRQRLFDAAEAFFALPMENKMAVHMSKSGMAWRGYFPVGDELTAGKVDQKEGCYFGREATQDDGEEANSRPLHGGNLWPTTDGFLPEGAPFPEAEEWRNVVHEYMEQCELVGHVLMNAIEVYLKLPPTTLLTTFKDPLVLFRAFHYPPHDEALVDGPWAVGKHSDYGYLTLLLQDDSGGLEVQNLTGQSGGDEEVWLNVPPIADSLILNIGDALEYASGGLLRATPHRVRPQRQHPSTETRKGRLSFPFFFDPNFDSKMQTLEPLFIPALQVRAAARRDASNHGANGRWDGKKVGAVIEGLPLDDEGDVTYGAYVVAKVAKVFPDLAKKASFTTGDSSDSSSDSAAFDDAGGSCQEIKSGQSESEKSPFTGGAKVASNMETKAREKSAIGGPGKRKPPASGTFSAAN